MRMRQGLAWTDIVLHRMPLRIPEQLSDCFWTSTSNKTAHVYIYVYNYVYVYI